MDKIKVKKSLISKEDQLILDKMYEDYLNCPEAVDFVKQNNINNDIVKEYILRINDFVYDTNYCKNCKGIKKCNKEYALNFRHLNYNNNIISLNITPCKELLKQFSIQSNFLINDMDDKYQKAVIKGIDRNNTRLPLVEQLVSIYKNKSKDWVYIKGSILTGKTYIASAFANEYTKNGKTCCFIDCNYTFKLLNDLSRSNKNEFDNLMNKIYRCDLLVLDGFGNEYKNDFIRDGILYEIISNRLNDNKPIIFTSEFSISEIKELYSLNRAGTIRSKQIADFIKNKSKVFDLGNNSVY